MTVETLEYRPVDPEVMVLTRTVGMMAKGTELQPMHKTYSEAVLHHTLSFGAG